MRFSWLKRYMPKGLYGRAALILLLPVLTLQIVVFFVFTQRHFSDVTAQLTEVTVADLELVLQAVNDAPNVDAALTTVQDRLAPLEIDVSPAIADDIPETDVRRWHDLTSLVFVPLLREAFPQTVAIDLEDRRRVRLFMQTRHGELEISMSRSRLSSSKTHQPYVSMILFGVLITTVSYIYLRNQLRPITRLAQAAEAYGRGRVIPYSPAGAQEVRAAGTAFLDMRNRIDRHIDQRTLLLSGVSHDLRTPLTRLRLGLSMLDAPDKEPLERDVAEMQRLVDEFLSFVKGAAEDETETVDVYSLLADAAARAIRAGHTVHLGAIPRDAKVKMRTIAVQRALDNLISNGARYGTEVEISADLTAKSLRLRVEDNGPGIQEAQRDNATRPFTRLDASRNQNQGAAVGLGLAIVTDIARAHGGMLQLGESTKMGGLLAELVIAR